MKVYDFVTMNEEGYYFISNIVDDVATIVGMSLNQTFDSVIFYSKKVDINELCYVTEYFVNINGPLAKLRNKMMNGIRDTYIIEEAINV